MIRHKTASVEGRGRTIGLSARSRIDAEGTVLWSEIASAWLWYKHEPVVVVRPPVHQTQSDFSGMADQVQNKHNKHDFRRVTLVEVTDTDQAIHRTITA